jgi:hypothetical protein
MHYISINSNHPNLELQYILIARDSWKHSIQWAKTDIQPEQTNKKKRENHPRGEEHTRITTLALVEYVPDFETCRLNRDVVFHVALVAYDNQDVRIAVIPMSDNAKACMREIQWAHVLDDQGRSKSKYREVIYQMAPSPFLSLMYAHTAIDWIADTMRRRNTTEDARESFHNFCLAAILGYNQCGHDGQFAYRVALLESMLPDNPQVQMPRKLSEYADDRVARVQNLQFRKVRHLSTADVYLQKTDEIELPLL